jgi:AcrR family transcriptional regulator
MSEPAPSDQPERAAYSSSRRGEQARATRRAIVAAAAELFVDQGYAATTIDAVASRAGVGRKTVFASVGGKSELLKLAWDWSIGGDDEPVPMSLRPAVQALLAEPDPQRLIEMWVDLQLEVGMRASPLGGAVLAAADVDEGARALRETIRRESLAGATAFVTDLAAKGGLRDGLDPARAADICWALVNSVLLHLLVEVRGWSPAEYGDWLVSLLRATLLEPVAGTAAVDGSPAVEIRHEREAHRYVATAGGLEVGRLTYEPAERVVVLLRTDADAATGVGDALLRHALDDVRNEGARRVVAVCPYASWWMDRHAAYAPLLLPL